MATPIRVIVFGMADLQGVDPLLTSVVAMADTLGAKLYLVHAFGLPDPILSPYAELELGNPELFRQHRDGLQARLETHLQSLATGHNAEARAVVGPPDRAIAEIAEEAKADLIIVGATRRGTLARTILGTTAQRVLRAARVLVLRQPLEAPVRQVLFTTDLSELSATAHREGSRIVQALWNGQEARFRSLLVLDYDTVLPPPLQVDVVHGAAASELDRFLARQRAAGWRGEGRVRVGDPAKEIVAEASDWPAELVVLGTHSRTGPERLLIGSIAEATVRNALTNVLVIPAAMSDRRNAARTTAHPAEPRPARSVRGAPVGAGAPTIRTLDQPACEAILERNHVGRLAYASRRRVDIEPLHYVYSDGWIYGRTSHGAKIGATGEEWKPVAFEVDEVEGIFEWRSVVAHGGFYVIPAEGAAWQREVWSRGVELLRAVIPDTFREDDPVPFRTVLFRIAVQEVSGREATTIAAAPAAAGQPG